MSDRRSSQLSAALTHTIATEGTMSASIHAPASCYEVRFASLFRPGRALAFPCDAQGRVDVDALPQSARENYLAACAMVGREYSLPEVGPADQSRH